jgi:hypothetical protein
MTQAAGSGTEDRSNFEGAKKTRHIKKYKNIQRKLERKEMIDAMQTCHLGLNKPGLATHLCI